MGSVRLEFDFSDQRSTLGPKKRLIKSLLTSNNTMGTYLDSIHSIRTHQSRSGTANFDAASPRARYKIGLSRMSHKLGGDACNLHRTTCVRDIEMLRDYTRS